MANDMVYTKTGQIQDTRPRLRRLHDSAHAKYQVSSIVNCIYKAVGYGMTAKEAYSDWIYTKCLIKMDDDFHLPKLNSVQRLIKWIKDL